MVMHVFIRNEDVVQLVLVWQCKSFWLPARHCTPSMPSLAQLQVFVQSADDGGNAGTTFGYKSLRYSPADYGTSEHWPSKQYGDGDWQG